MLSKGEIHMTALNMVRPCLTPDNHLEILRLCKHQTRVEVELLVAERFPERAKHKKKRKPKAEIRALPSLALDNLGSAILGSAILSGGTLFGDNPQRELSPKPAEESIQPRQNASA